MDPTPKIVRCPCGGFIDSVESVYRGGQCNMCGKGYLLTFDDEGNFQNAVSSVTIESLIRHSERQRAAFERFFSNSVEPEDRAAFIRAEVEAMDWPDTIKVPWLPE